MGGTAGLVTVITLGALSVVLVGFFIGKRWWKRSHEASSRKEEHIRRRSTVAASERSASNSSDEGVRDSFKMHQDSLENPLSHRHVFPQTPRKSSAHSEEIQLAQELAPRSQETPPSPRTLHSPTLANMMGEREVESSHGAKSVTYNPFFGLAGSRPEGALLQKPAASSSSPVEDLPLLQMMAAADETLRKQTASRSLTGNSSSHGSEANPGKKKEGEAATATAGVPRQSPSSRQSGTEGTRRLNFSLQGRR